MRDNWKAHTGATRPKDAMFTDPMFPHGFHTSDAGLLEGYVRGDCDWPMVEDRTDYGGCWVRKPQWGNFQLTYKLYISYLEVTRGDEPEAQAISYYFSEELIEFCKKLTSWTA